MGTEGKWTVTCESCAVSWNRTGGLTDHERQALESRPCPVCEAYTLSCSTPRPTSARRQIRLDYRLHQAA